MAGGDPVLKFAASPGSTKQWEISPLQPQRWAIAKALGGAAYAQLETTALRELYKPNAFREIAMKMLDISEGTDETQAVDWLTEAALTEAA